MLFAEPNLIRVYQILDSNTQNHFYPNFQLTGRRQNIFGLLSELCMLRGQGIERRLLNFANKGLV